jgi:hypothetical protein
MMYVRPRETIVCWFCHATFEAFRRADRKVKYCSRSCSNKATKKRKTEHRTFYYSPSKGCWIGRGDRDGKTHTVSGPTRTAVEAKLALWWNGVPMRSHHRWDSISPATVRYALSLLQPLDHIERYERQQQAVKILEDAICYAEANLAPAVSKIESDGTVTVTRQRPAWLDALPMRDVG